MTKAVLDGNKINMEELLILDKAIIFIILLGLTGYKMIMTTYVLSTSAELVTYHFTSSVPS